MWQLRLGSIEFHVEHRRAGGDGGATLRVLHAEPGRELLRFDCFEHGPHFHFDPGGRDEITQLDPLADNVAWTVGELRRDLAAYLGKAGFEGESDWSAEECDRSLSRVEDALRNPPARFDDLDLELLASRKSEKWHTYPSDILPAWVAEMDFPLAEPIRLVLQRAVDRWDLGYPIDRNATGLREAFADHMQARFDWTIEPARCEIITDVVQGIYTALQAFGSERDGAVVQTPIYPPFLSAVSDTGARLIENRLLATSEGFRIDFDALRAAVDVRAGVFLLCNPHNPTGRVFTRTELEQLAALVVERDLIVVTDEIHADLVFAGHEHIPFATLGPEVASRTITLTSATKAFNIPGLRCALAHFGSESLQRRFAQAVPSHIRGGIGLLGLYATIAAWRHSLPWLEEVRPYLEANRDFLAQQLAAHFPEIVCHVPESTYLAWLDCSALDLPRTPGRVFLKRGQVALSDGRHFGSGWEGYARLNFATSRAILQQVLGRMATALDRSLPPDSAR